MQVFINKLLTSQSLRFTDGSFFDRIRGVHSAPKPSERFAYDVRGPWPNQPGKRCTADSWAFGGPSRAPSGTAGYPANLAGAARLATTRTWESLVRARPARLWKIAPGEG